MVEGAVVGTVFVVAGASVLAEEAAVVESLAPVVTAWDCVFTVEELEAPAPVVEALMDVV